MECVGKNKWEPFMECSNAGLLHLAEHLPDERMLDVHRSPFPCTTDNLYNMVLNKL